ncbi:hypothetical protein [Skermania piniformis]|uniref:Uncharacterized protein n=1 Tax=Skermania pinensis TaxID=39122 RepID=A0ABX8S3D7_9ACTN|nr:hypothetical protein [Skermania piniformis]QXQ12314.1 hypothetical protein KV203_09885 [Skermania piniformis]
MGTARRAAEAGLNTIWVVFLVDYLARLAAADRRAHWLVTHLDELAAVVLPMFRTLQVLRLVTLPRVLGRSIGQGFRDRVAMYTGVSTLLLLYLGALAILAVERDADGATIRSFPDALWWSG